MKRKNIIWVVIAFIFCMFFDVRAIDITIDTNTKGTVDPNSYLITTYGTVEMNFDVVDLDAFYAYKLLDSFYNSTSNVITYEFTSTFKTFLASNTTYKNLTVAEYYNLTSNNLDKLASTYATYLRKNSITTDLQGDFLLSLPAGAYLLLPITTTKIYSVMVVNPVIYSDSKGNWAKTDMYFEPKVSAPSVTKSVGAVGTVTKSYGLSDTIPYYLTATFPTYPTNATNRVYIINDTLGAGLTFTSLSDITITDGDTLNNSNGTFKDSSGNTVATASISGQKLTITFNPNYVNSTAVSISYKAKLNTSAVLGTVGNLNSAVLTYSNDPYGNGTTTTSAFTTTVYTYGIELLAYDKSNTSTKLPGAYYDVYSDSGLTKKVGTITTGSDGIGTLRGVSEGTYYIKNTKASTGYELATTTSMKVKITGSVAGTTEGYYKVEMPVTKSPSLPYTGGVGTIIYTIIGMIVIVSAIVGFTLYKNRDKGRGLS